MEKCSLTLLCPGTCSPIQAASDYSLHQEQNFPVKVRLRECHNFAPTFMPSNRAPVIIPCIITQAIIRPRIVRARMNCQCSTTVQIPEFVNLSLFSGFSGPINHFSKFYPCTNLWHLWMCHGIFRLTYLPCSFLSQHSWTVTCSVCHSCHCQFVALREQCSLFENVLHRSLNNHLVHSMTLFRSQMQQN